MRGVPIYRQLRDIGLGETYRVEGRKAEDDFGEILISVVRPKAPAQIGSVEKGFTMSVDAATFQFVKGTLTFMRPVEGVVTGAIFIGEGHFNLKPVSGIGSTLGYRDNRLAARNCKCNL